MEYLLLIYENEKNWETMPQAEQGAMFGEYMSFTEDIKKKGNYKGGNALQPTATATTVRVRGGKTLATDGPFAETKEQLAGYTILEAKDLDEALAFVARHPLVRAGFSIEVRPIRVGPPK
jgi:hypothetical protein